MNMFKVFVFASKSIIAAGALLAMFISMPAGATAITDGDFESLPLGLASGGYGTLTVNDWTFGDFAGVESHGGGKVVRLESSGSAFFDPTARQTVSGLTIGQTYNVFWDLARRIDFGGSGNGPSFGVFLDTQSFGTALHLETYLSTTFAARSTSFLATATSHTIIFAGELDARSNGGFTTDVSYRIDNVSMSAASISENWGAAGLGLTASLLVWRRRRSVKNPRVRA
ncbi:MAG: hypothetical protein ACPGRZ_10035 [Alphaproteobacteria bacterium]